MFFKSFLSVTCRHRRLIISNIKADIATRFAASRFGFFWLILHPLAQVAIYVLVLSQVIAAKIPGIDSGHGYVIYLMSGFLGWTLFSEIVSGCVNLFPENAHLLKKLAFPRICLPIIVLGKALLNNGMLFLSMLFIISLLGHLPSLALVWLPFILAVNLMFAFGLGVILGVINVFVRDVGQIMSIILQFWFWLTPIVYTMDIIPNGFKGFMALNPMYYIVAGYQSILVTNTAPDYLGLLVVATVSLLMCGLSLFVFRRASAELVDAL